MVSELDSGSSGQGSSPAQGHCVVFLGKTGVQIGTGKFNAGGNLRWTSIPSREGSRNITGRLMIKKLGLVPA